MDKKGTLQKPAKCLKSFVYAVFPQQCLYFLPEPHGHGELRSAIVFYLLSSSTITEKWLGQWVFKSFCILAHFLVFFNIFLKVDTKWTLTTKKGRNYILPYFY